MAELPLPFEEIAEKTILSELLCRPEESYDRVVGITEKQHFYLRQHAEIFNSIVALHERGDKVDPAAVAIELRAHNLLDQCGGTPFLLRLTNEVPATVHVEQFARVVRDKWRMRQLINLFIAKSAEARGGNLPTTEQRWMEEIESQVSALVHDGNQQEIRVLRDILQQVIHDLREGPQQEGANATGYLDLDRLMGGVYESDLVVLAGRPGMGKSALAQNIGVNIAKRGRGVAFFSLEMPDDQIAMRVLCSETLLDFGQYRRREFKEKEKIDWVKVTEGCQRLNDLPFWVYDKPGLRAAEIRAVSRQLARAIEQKRSDVPAEGLGLVVVDYLQLVKGQREHGWSREQEVASIPRDLKALAKELSVPVLALSQLNRAVEQRPGKEKIPQLSDLRESGAIEQDADAVIFMYRPEYYNDGERPNECDIIVAKQRNGPTGTVALHFNGKSMRFSNLAAGLAVEIEDMMSADDTWYQDR